MTVRKVGKVRNDGIVLNIECKRFRSLMPVEMKGERDEKMIAIQLSVVPTGKRVVSALGNKVSRDCGCCPPVWGAVPVANLRLAIDVRRCCIGSCSNRATIACGGGSLISALVVRWQGARDALEVV
jgi:hypothetical protein